MSIEAVRNYLKKYNRENDILEFGESSATVALAAKALGTEPGRIAKTLSFKKDDGCIIVVMAGDVKVDNSKYKHTFGLKAKMLTPQEVIDFTGHEIGGVCPFALVNADNVYLDESLKRFATVYPACGSSNSAIELTPDELFELSSACGWVNISKAAE